MKRFIQTKHTINAPIDKVWDLIKTGKDWENWFDMLTGSRVEGNTRFCDLDNGDTLEEAFLASNAEKTFVYTIHKQASFPAENIVGIIHLEAIDANNTNVKWSVEMDIVSQEIFNELKSSIEEMYTNAVSKLEILASTDTVII